VFFFQAEDGIRDFHVTGVQTCALPICPIENFPVTILNDENRKLALLFKQLATLRTDAPLFANVDELRWQGPRESFTAIGERFGDTRIIERAKKARSLQTRALRT